MAEALAAGEEEAEVVAAAAVTPRAKWQGPEAATKVRPRHLAAAAKAQALSAEFAREAVKKEGPPALIEESEDEDGPGEPRDEVEPESDEDDEDMIGLISQGMPKEVAANFASFCF